MLHMRVDVNQNEDATGGCFTARRVHYSKKSGPVAPQIPCAGNGSDISFGAAVWDAKQHCGYARQDNDVISMCSPMRGMPRYGARPVAKDGDE
jgi:hypothetical protein